MINVAMIDLISRRLALESGVNWRDICPVSVVSEWVGPQADTVPSDVDLDPRIISIIRRCWSSELEKDQRAAHVQEGRAVFGQAQPAPEDDSVAVFP
ncbi:hypothetical protein [Streptomyces decoyicus]|uniref:hypothetical protein n=1 Tax=Streptomyces decoyicus TaxID=249567 RepID=UPI00386AC6DF